MSIITQFSLFFIRRWRFTILLLLGILVLGGLSYSTFLKKEGFPSVQPPVAFMTVSYPVNDADTIRSEVTSPIETALNDVSEIKTISSTTNANTANLQFEFNQQVSADTGVTRIKDAVQTQVSLPEKAELSYNTVNAAAINGEHEMLLTLSNPDASLKEIQTQAQTLAEEIQTQSEVSQAEAIKVFQERTNPRTGETTTEQVSFARSGVKEEGQLTFEDGVQIGMVRNENFDTLAFSESVRSTVTQSLKDGTLSEEYKVTYAYDPANQLNDQLSTLENSALTGLLAVAVVVLLLISWRASILVAIFLPTVMAGTFIGLFLLGLSLNTITLFGIILVLGLIADDAIIVIDAIDYYRKQGYKGIKASREAINSIGPADIAGTVTTVLVFIPLLFVTGILGDFIRLMPATIILSLSISLFIGISLMPLLGNSLLPRYQPSTNPFFFAPRILDWLNAKLHKFVKGYVKDPILIGVMFIVGVSLVGGLSFYFQKELKFELFAPASDTDQIIVQGSFDQGTTISEAQNIATEIENRIAGSNQTVHIQDVGYITANQSQLTLFIDLLPMEQRVPTSTTILADLEQHLQNIENIDLTLGKGGAGPPSQQYQMTFNVFSDDQEALETVTSDLQTYLEEDISLAQGEVTKTNITNLESISTRGGERYASVQVGVSDPNNTDLITSIKTQVQDNFNTPDYRSEQDISENAIRSDLGQQGDNLQSFRSALFAMGVALIAMYMLLVLQFNSFLQPFLILSAIPLSLPGVFMGLFFTGNAFSFFATVGIIGLTGVVVNNTIILIDAANQYRNQGLQLPEAISEAVKLRFRPLVTTTLTTLVGMLPLALSDPFWEGLAFALVFGLISSTFFVLLLFPAFYMIIEHMRRRRLQVTIIGSTLALILGALGFLVIYVVNG